MLEVVTSFGALLHSVWLLPLLVAMIALDAPFPVLPSETLLMSAATLAFGRYDAVAVAGLFVAALVGSTLGDLITFGLGRSSHRILAPSTDADNALAAWVRRHMLLRPGVALVGARFVPGGRLVSTAAAGRVGLSLRRFLLWSVVSSAAWSGYMVLIGLALGPITGGSPLLCLLAGAAMGVLTAVVFGVIGRVRARRLSATPSVDAELVRLG